MKLTSKILMSAIALTSSVVLATAQDANKDANAAGGNRQRGNFNPEEFRARMEDRLKTSLKVSDDEWKVLQPLLEKVTTKQRDAMGSRFGGFGGRGGPGGPGGDRGGNATGTGTGGDQASRGGSSESQALRTALENESASADDLKAKLTAVRDARKKAAEELAAARADLAKVLTVRQEAVLVSMGILD